MARPPRAPRRCRLGSISMVVPSGTSSTGDGPKRPSVRGSTCWTPPPTRCSPPWPRDRAVMSMRPSLRHARRFRRGGNSPRRSAPNISTRSPAPSSATRDGWPCSNHWTTARASAKRATSTSRSSHAICTITQAGRSSWTASSPGITGWASSARSSRGTSRCSCSPGRSAPRSRPVAPSCSNRRNSRRSPRSPSPNWRTRRGSHRASSTS